MYIWNTDVKLQSYPRLLCTWLYVLKTSSFTGCMTRVIQLLALKVLRKALKNSSLTTVSNTPLNLWLVASSLYTRFVFIFLSDNLICYFSDHLTCPVYTKAPIFQSYHQPAAFYIVHSAAEIIDPLNFLH